jgi:hypothetical protein
MFLTGKFALACVMHIGIPIHDIRFPADIGRSSYPLLGEVGGGWALEWISNGYARIQNIMHRAV